MDEQTAGTSNYFITRNSNVKMLPHNCFKPMKTTIILLLLFLAYSQRIAVSAQSAFFGTGRSIDAASKELYSFYECYLNYFQLVEKNVSAMFV
jgi:hypothetical protein